MSNNRYANIINPNSSTGSSGGGLTNPLGSILNCGGNEIQNMANGTLATSATTLGQVQTLISAGGGGGSGIAGLTAINDVLKYNGDVVLCAQSGTSNIETLTATSNYVANSVLLAHPHSSSIHNNPPKIAETITTSNFVFGSGMSLTNDKNLQGIAGNSSSISSQFVFNGGCSLGFTGMSVVSGSGASRIVSLGFYIFNPTSPPLDPYYSVQFLDNSNNTSWARVLCLDANNNLKISNLNFAVNYTDTVSLVYNNQTFELYVNNIIQPNASSSNPAFANLPVSTTSNLCLVGTFACNNNNIIIGPNFAQSSALERYSNINSTGQIIAKATTSSVPNIENDYLNNIRIPINPISVFPQTIPDPTTNSLLEIFILDANNVNLMTSGPAFSCYSPSQYFTWNASTSIMTFNYQSQSQNPQHTTDTNDYFYTASNWNTATLTGPYTYFYLWTTFQQTYTFSSSPILTCSFEEDLGDAYLYPLCSKNNGTSTSINIGNHGEKDIVFTNDEMFYNSNKFITSGNVGQYVTNISGLDVDPTTHQLEFNNQAVITSGTIGQYLTPVTGLSVNPVTKLLTFEGQAVMINQYDSFLQPTTMTVPAITAQTYLESMNTVFATGTLTGNFQDLFTTNTEFSFNISMTSADPPDQFAWSLPVSSSSCTIAIGIDIIDSNGTNIVKNLTSDQHSFTFINEGFTYNTGVITFNKKVNKFTTGDIQEQFYFYTNELDTTLLPPFSLTYRFNALYALPNTRLGYNTIDEINSAGFSITMPDITNPYPVVSNYNPQTQITTIRTNDNGPVINTSVNAFNIGTSYLSLNPPNPVISNTGTSLSKWRKGVISGNWLINTVPNTAGLGIFTSIPDIPQSVFFYSMTLFLFIHDGLFTSYAFNGVCIMDHIPQQFVRQSGQVLCMGALNTVPSFDVTSLILQIYGSNINVNFNLNYEVEAQFSLTYELIML